MRRILGIMGLVVAAVVISLASLVGGMAYAGGGGPTPTPTTIPTTTSPRAIVAVSWSCAGPHTLVPTSHVDLAIDARILSPVLGYWYEVSDGTITAHYGAGSAVSSTLGDHAEFHGSISSIRWEGTVQLFPGGTYTVTVAEAPYDGVGLPTSETVLAYNVFTIGTCPTPTPTATITPTAISTQQVPPVITKVTPMEAAPGQQVVVEGQNFRRPNEISLYVWLERDGGGIELAHFNPEYNSQYWTSTAVTFTMPNLSPRSGLIRLDVNSRLAYAGGTFIILPEVPTATPTATVEPIPFPPTYIDVPLVNGWNLVSIPSANSAYTARSLLAEMSSQGIEVAQIASWENGGWHSYLSGLPTDGFSIRSGLGYFVRVTRSGTWHPGYRR